MALAAKMKRSTVAGPLALKAALQGKSCPALVSAAMLRSCCRALAAPLLLLLLAGPAVWTGSRGGVRPPATCCTVGGGQSEMKPSWLMGGSE